MKQVPILFLSDSPELPTGLARITKDLAVLTSELPEFRVGVLGRGGHGSSKLPFAQYNFPETAQWGEHHIESAWDDFAGKELGIVFTIWDASRLGWFAQPRMEGQLGKFLRSKRFVKWGYFPVDSYGIGGKLTGRMKDTLQGYDRHLAYTMFGKQILESTLSDAGNVVELDWIPHGYNNNVFVPRDRVAARMSMGIDNSTELVGCVMTNQARKDWATAFGAMAYLKNKRPGIRMWAHVDVVERYWNLYALIEDFGLRDTVHLTFSGEYSSEQLSYMYSACNVTMLPSLGEGMGYPLIESMACGVPVVHGNYGGGVEIIPETSWLVERAAERLDGMWNCVRPVWNPIAWATVIGNVLDAAKDGQLQETCTRAVEHLQWGKLWPSAWKKWLLAGIGR